MTQNLSTHDRLISLIAPLVAPIGYEIIHLEVLIGRANTLRLFIDRLEGHPGGPIGVEDCALVSRTLDEPLDAIPELEAAFKGPYELEVSSPGVDRPLRLSRDFEKFSGKEARIHVFRPLSASELGNAAYQARNPKQKNFLGVLRGVRGESVILALSAQDGKPGKAAQRNPKTATGAAGEEVTIPLPLIAKANLEPKFDFDQVHGNEESA
jgi:ribosome maturation factor RimP